MSKEIAFIAHTHWKTNQQTERTSENMIHNMSLDFIGLPVTMSAAIYTGRKVVSGRGCWKSNCDNFDSLASIGE